MSPLKGVTRTGATIRTPVRVRLDTMRLAGIDVSELDCLALIDLLQRVGRDADLALAQRIERGLDRAVRTLPLSPAERDQLLGVLDKPPDSLLEFRGDARPRPSRAIVS